MEKRHLHMGVDVGVRNMAFCVVDADLWKNGDLGSAVIEWKNVSLLGEPEKCSAIVKSGAGKGKVCGKLASIHVDTLTTDSVNIVLHLCKRHAAVASTASTASITEPTTPKSRGGAAERARVRDFSSTDLIKMAVQTFDRFSDLFKQVETIVIELQPTMNPTMKSLSYAVLTYFTIRYQIDVIDPILKTVKFSSAKNKLKVNVPGLTERTILSPTATSATSTTKDMVFKTATKTRGAAAERGGYRQTKNTGKQYTETLLQTVPDVLAKFYHSAGSKKDDLADAFLHAIYSISGNGIVKKSKTTGRNVAAKRGNGVKHAN